MDLAAVQDAILVQAGEALPGLAQVEPYAGQFGPEGPTQGRVVAPAFFVAALEAPLADEQPGEGRIALDVRWAAYCLARNARGAAKRGRDAMSLAVSWAQQVQHAQWGLAPDVMHARLAGLENLYSAALDAKGFALWAVVWRQVVLVGETAWDGSGETPSEVWAGWQPEQFPDDYERIDGEEVS
ncbi:hypothetical protein Tgr7_1634 [Thioalkalivibrio sulfidiphilus HL-EbGr7]|uniref:Uncharacterized protein n=1 Tax=Thioalkalivibrio sulfidiphilus (strain HL-EbGR7) TaxID=396588 RepID=B8GS13_THISH|nr:phage protein Gp37 [Thioalkalivibrio sulfidiphilus]ACL72717.1 hypothetical protein Tgr7_1634 [Thioalkalivibrio sulfidiphilus HL-EbGr7]